MKAEYLDHMGNDLAVVNAAKVSFSSEVKDLDEKGEKLISYLAKHGHWTPFAHTSIKLRMKAPVPIRTQC
jgi:thymidylate synthase (FAD)